MIANKKSLLALSVASALMLSGCFSDDDNNVTITPPPPEPTDPVVVAPETPEAISFLVSAAVVANEDYGTGDDAIEAGDAVNATVSFFEDGEASTNILNEDGEAVTSIETGEEGSFAFRLKDGADLEAVTISVMADGYFSKSFRVNLDAAGDAKVLEVQLPMVSKMVDDVAEAAETVATNDDGEVSGAAPAEAKDAEGNVLASAEIADNTILKDAAGEVVSGDDLQLNVVGAKAGSDNANSIVPEGLNSGDATTVKSPVTVADVTLTLGDRKVKQFENGTLNVSMAAPADTTTSAGLSVSSYDEDTATWKDEDFDVSVNGSRLTFDTDHLTFFAINKESDICNEGITATVTGDTPTGPLFVIMRASDLPLAVAPLAFLQQGIPAALTTVFGVSDGAEARVVIRDLEGAAWYDSQNDGDANDDGEIGVCGTFNAELSAPYTPINKTLELTGVCADDTADVTVDVSNSIVRYRLGNKGVRKTLANEDGNFELTNIRQGENYTVNVDFRGLELADGQSESFNLEEVTDETYSQEFQFQCDTTTGSTGTTGGG